LLASVGRSLILVRQRPRVAILSTGNELAEVDEVLHPGQIVNSNAYTLAAAVREAGGQPVPLAIARDTLIEIQAVLSEAVRHDVVLSTGGVSVGDFDFVKAAMDELGIQRLFWQVAQRPGKPLTFGEGLVVGRAELSLLPEGMDVQVIVLDSDQFAGEVAPF